MLQTKSSSERQRRTCLMPTFCGRQVGGAGERVHSLLMTNETSLPTDENGDIDMLALFAQVEEEIASGKLIIEPSVPAKPVIAPHYVCNRCAGTGHLEQYRHVAGGNCFGCSGTGDIRYR